MNPVHFLVLIVAMLSVLAAATPGFVVPMHSFKAPFSTGKNGIRWWDVGGEVFVQQDSIHLTENVKSKKGFVWNRSPVMLKDWEVDLEFKITGADRLGADGLAFWYARDRMVEGDAFGSKATWNGLGVFVDTFDNDRKRDNPYINIIVNDGTKTYSADKDGKDIQSAGCMAQVRKTENPVWLRVRHDSSKGEVTVSYSLVAGAPDHEGSWKICGTVRADLPTGYYFGVSAATGGLSDVHEVLSFSTKRTGQSEDVSEKQDEKIRELRGENREEPRNNPNFERMERDNKPNNNNEVENKLRSFVQTQNNRPKVDVSSLSTEQRIERLELLLSEIEKQSQTVKESIDAVVRGSSTLDSVKSRLDSMAENSNHQAALRSEISKQSQEIERVTKQVEEKISSEMETRFRELETQINLLKDAVGQKQEEEKNLKTGKAAGNALYYVVAVVMALQTIGALVYFGSQRNKSREKLW